MVWLDDAEMDYSERKKTWDAEVDRYGKIIESNLRDMARKKWGANYEFTSLGKVGSHTWTVFVGSPDDHEEFRVEAYETSEKKMVRFQILK